MASTKLAPITADPRYAEIATDLKKHEDRLAKTHAERDRAIRIKRGAKSGRSKLAQAADLVKGGFVNPVDPDEVLRACDQEEAILVPAIRDLADKLRQMTDDISYEVCQRLQAEHTAHLRAALKASRDLVAAFQAAADLRARLRDAGYNPLDAVLPSGMPPFVLAIGNGEGDGKQIDQFVRYVRMHAPGVTL